MKPALYVGLKGDFQFLPTYRAMSDKDLILVTSQRGTKVYGRNAHDGGTTSYRAHWIVAQFDTLEQAREVIASSNRAYEAYASAIARAEGEFRTLRTTQSSAMTQAIAPFKTVFAR